jgi:hypothetical protein
MSRARFDFPTMLREIRIGSIRSSLIRCSIDIDSSFFPSFLRYASRASRRKCKVAIEAFNHGNYRTWLVANLFDAKFRVS